MKMLNFTYIKNEDQDKKLDKIRKHVMEIFI